jgi:hypothetical protein
MPNDPFTGRGLRAPERSRILVATEDGGFLWPGTPLVYRIGNGFFAAEPRAVNSATVRPQLELLPARQILHRI